MKKIYISFLLSALLMISCQKDETIADSIIKDSGAEVTELDTWIYDNFTKPFNIQVKYKWDESEVAGDKILTPVKEEMVKPFLEAVLSIWVKPYVDVIGDEFIKLYIPKQLMLVGSGNYMSDGSVMMGQAESGKKITVFGINEFSTKRRSKLVSQFHTIHHEFAHILHQTKMYPSDFASVTPGDYTNQWYDPNVNKSYKEKGFISEYSMSNVNEDFVEIVSTLLTSEVDDWKYKTEEFNIYTSDAFGAPVDEAKTKIARELIKKKEKIVVDYFKRTWNIDLYELQKIINNEIDNIDKV